jgi:isopropylmalate/homocitrate/citramalate synthase
MDEKENKEIRDDVFSKAVKAGKRTYFFDIKKSKKDDYYLTITESKKLINSQTGQSFYDKHKIFLYPEDLQKLNEVFQEVISLIEKRRNNELSDEDLIRLKKEAIEQFNAQEINKRRDD